MGKIKQGILGSFSGKVGAVIGGSWKGIAYMRGIAPRRVDSRTDLQLEQRMRFSVTIKFLRAFSQFLKIGFKNYANGMTCFNNAVQYNVLNAIQDDYPNFTINYPDALVTRGHLAPALNAVAASAAPGTVLFTWEDNSGELDASPLDNSLLLVYNPAKNQAVYFNALSERADGTQSVTVPNSFSGDLVHCYIGFITADRFSLSNSEYAGAITLT